MLNTIQVIPSFRIGDPFGEKISEESLHLLMEIGDGSVTLAVYREGKKMLLGLEHYLITENADGIERQLADFLLTHEWVKKNYKAVWICFNTADAMLFPEELHDPAVQELVMNTVMGDLPDGEVINELIEGKSMYCVYRIPSSLYDLIGSRFGEESATHFYTVSARTNIPSGEGMRVCIGHGRMVVSLVSDGKLILMQNYPARNGQEAAYHLLNIRHQFGLNAETFPVEISGMVQEDSALYTEISKYFLNLTLSERPSVLNYAEAFDEHPQHYFQTIYKLAVCVSLEVD